MVFLTEARIIPTITGIIFPHWNQHVTYILIYTMGVLKVIT